ncbi:hypothetical protein JVT61DRAFT_4411 [Boletus reticuloceps]|uniref:THUMP domain-containing protein n=1 Tax=Boletus reticuloceps TaxID=495285 RepID=A0A8I3A912_9AGAM|nr:hypothetical protein JVT61DRAFT_4411 [Boletus reticuloceps]
MASGRRGRGWGTSTLRKMEKKDVDFEALVAQELAAIKRPRIKSDLLNQLSGLYFLQAPNRSSQADCHTCRECPKDRRSENKVRVLDHSAHLELTWSRYTHRLIPVAGSCVANLPEIHSLCRRVFASFFAEAEASASTPQVHKYKIELRVRNHSTLTRMDIIEEIAKCMPQDYVVDLNNPDVFVLVEVFKVCHATIQSRYIQLKRWLQSVCGVSILRDYYKLHKFNVMMLANEKNAVEDFKPEAGRVQGKQVDEVDPACVASRSL